MQATLSETLPRIATLEIPKLIEDLHRPDRQSRMEAAYRLGAMGHYALVAVPALRRQLDDGDVNFRLTAAAAILAIEGNCPRARRILIDGIGHDNMQVRTRAMSTIARLPDGTFALPALRIALADVSAEIRIAAADALFRIEPGNAAAVAALLELAEDPRASRIVRDATFRTLGEMKVRRALPVLWRTLRDDPDGYEEAVVGAIAAIESAPRTHQRPTDR